MKYINNNTSLNIITDSDINLSESFQNQKLSEVLVEYKNDLDLLKSNVKWLAKYGGVGGSGSGSGGSSNIKLKYNVNINYTTDNDISLQLTFKSKTNSKIIAKSDSRAVIMVELTSCAPNTNYSVIINYNNKTVGNGVVSAQLLTYTTSITCEGNSTISISVYAIPNDIVKTDISVFTQIKQDSLDILVEKTIISNGGTLLESLKVKAKIVGKLINYLPDQFLCEIKSLTINGIGVEIEKNITSGNSGESIHLVEIDTNRCFGDYGIYEVILTYIYNEQEFFIKKSYVFKDSGIFVYCFGQINTVYSKQQDTPLTSNNTLESVKFIVYPKENDADNQPYEIHYKVSYEDAENKNYETTINITSNTTNEILISNVYSKSNFDNSRYKQVTIEFYNDDFRNFYYLYVTQLPDIDYVFKNPGNNDLLCYGSLHSCTATLNEDLDPCVDFPFIRGKYLTVLKDTEFPINKIVNLTKMTSAATSVYGAAPNYTNGYITNANIQDGGTNADILFSFGIKYNEYNKDLPIISIKISEKYTITIYSNKIEYGNSYSRWYIPDDGEYHLILLYYKPTYDLYKENYKSAYPKQSAFIFCIDGVFETSPLFMSDQASFTVGNSKIIYHPGNWDFDFIGLLSFNAKLNSSLWLSQASSIPDTVIRYILDFDPIIPANYYQAYLTLKKILLKSTFDSSIYNTLYSSDYGVNFYKNFNKFIPADVVSLGKLTNLPIYIINPEPNEGKINNFLENTLTGYNESGVIIPTKICSLKRGIIDGTVLKTVDFVNDDKYKFQITYQGSSTLKYGVKNFEISSVTYVDENDKPHDIYWTPDENLFQPETAFYLKADMVDSSHSNNVIVGKFVNDYMSNSKFEGGSKVCLEGFPVLLFMEDNIQNTDPSSSNHTIFLGIYNFNLGRMSHCNLGYKKLDLDKCTSISSENSLGIKSYLTNEGAISFPHEYRVAEVLDNSHVLYDYSQYDEKLLQNMLGDFFNRTGNNEANTYLNSFQKPFKSLGKLINEHFVKKLNGFTTYTFTDNDQLIGYYKTGPTTPFNVLLLNFNYNGKQLVTDEMYYYSKNEILRVPKNALVLGKDDIRKILPYSTLGDNNYTVINNPFYQFHPICAENGNTTYDAYYVEQLTTDSLTTFDTTDDYFDYDTLLRYYMVCMLFAMVDSVQKNLTIRCLDFDGTKANKWLVGFYDMDTAFGVDNAGNPVDFRAFSDYINNDGKIIQDYFKSKSDLDGSLDETSDGSLYDVPSSFLFLIAKYLNILSTEENAANSPYVFTDSGILITPFNYWLNLRDRGGILENVDEFFKNYVNNYFSDINPLIWNLNYLYKYFSDSNNTDTNDTELSRFNGTRRYSRKNWMNERLSILDVLFGIKNNRRVGNLTELYICKLSRNLSEQYKYSGFINNVPIAHTMFPFFRKGCSGLILVEATVQPKTPVILLTTTNDTTVYMADTTGKIKNISTNIESNVDCSFYGSQKLKSLSDCGQFLIYPGLENGIENNVISDIKILTGSASSTIKLELDKIASAKNISIGKETTVNRCKWNSIKIIALNFEQDRIIDSITIKYSDIANEISINNNSSKNLIINNLTIQHNTAPKLSLKNVVVKSITINGNRFTTYDISGKFPNLIVNDTSASTFIANIYADNTTKAPEISLGTNNLKELLIEGYVSKLYSHSLYCTKLTINNISSETVHLDLNYFHGYAYLESDDLDMTFKFTSAVKLLTLKLINNLYCKKCNIYAPNLEKVYLEDSCFYQNRELTEINYYKGNNSPVPLILSIPIYIKGSEVFSRCYKLNPIHCVPIQGKPFIIETNNLNNMYTGTNVTMTDVISIFNHINIIDNNLPMLFKNMFRECKNLELGNNLTKLKNALLPFKNSVFDSIFAYTHMNYLDSDLVNIYKRENILPDISPQAKQGYVLADLDFLKDTNVLQITIGNFIYNPNTGKNDPRIPIKLSIPDNMKTDEDGEPIIPKLKLNEILNSGDLQIINNIAFETNAEYIIDYDSGIPNTVKKIKAFGLDITSEHDKIINFEKLFNGVNNTCEVYVEDFMGYTPEDFKINIFKLFWKEINSNEISNKVTMRLERKSSISTTVNKSQIANRMTPELSGRFTFYRECTAKQFKSIMKYLTGLQDLFLEGKTSNNCDLYNLIPKLFYRCKIFDVENFEDLIKKDNMFTWFDLRKLDDKTVGFIDLDHSFYECCLYNKEGEPIPFDVEKMWCAKENDETFINTPVLNMKYAFFGTYLKKIHNPLHLKWVKNMNSCFANCSYDYSDLNDFPPYLSMAWPENFDMHLAIPNNYPLIPPKFFDIGSKCDISNCFATSLYSNPGSSKQNLMGQLPTNKDEWWWSKTNAVDNNTVPNLTEASIIIPIQKGNNYYSYPEYYSEQMKSYHSCYNHIVIPLLLVSDAEQKLYIFEKDGPLILKPSLPCLPYWSRESPTASANWFKIEGTLILRIWLNKSGNLYKHQSMSKEDYNKLMPMSLFSILQSLYLNNLNITDGIKLQYGDNWYSWGIPMWNTASPTPGGLLLTNFGDYKTIVNV